MASITNKIIGTIFLLFILFLLSIQGAAAIFAIAVFFVYGHIAFFADGSDSCTAGGTVCV
jgi:hypothetical protein